MKRLYIRPEFRGTGIGAGSSWRSWMRRAPSVTIASGWTPCPKCAPRKAYTNPWDFARSRRIDSIQWQARGFSKRI